MLSAETAISLLRRDLTVGVLVKGLLVAAVGAAMAVPALVPEVDRAVLLLGVVGIWIALSYVSAQGSRLAIDSPSLIAAGQYEEAERQINQVLRRFSLFRAVKLQSVHHLALLRHAQHRWRESALLCRALLGQRLGPLQGLSKPSRLLLAEATLELNDLRGAYEALVGLYAQRLSLPEVLHLLQVQLDYESRIGAWEAMMSGPMGKVQLAELMPSLSSARTQAFLALAASHIGRQDWCDWLRRRVELLVDPTRLTSERRGLAELWPTPRAGPPI